MEDQQGASECDVTLALSALGYVGIPVTRTPVGHLQADGAIERRPARLLIDTGASATVIDRAYAERIAFAREPTTETAAGCPGSALETARLEAGTLDRLEFGRVLLRGVPVRVMDLAPVNAQLEAAGSGRVNGIIGADLLEREEAVIDCSRRILHLRWGEGSVAT